MARISNEISSIEVAAYAEFCKANNIIHDGTPDDVANSDLVLEYFTKTWNEVINDQTLTQAFPQLKEHLKFNSAARIEVQRLVREYADANALSAWFDTQTLLSKEGDDGFRNFSEIVLELQGRPATQANISSAIMSIQRATEGGSVGKFSTRHRRPLVYAQKKTERTKSFHQQTDDGTNPFTNSGLTKQRDGSYGKSPAQYAAEAREYAEKNNPQPTEQEKLSESDAAWKRVFDQAVASGADWRRVYEACNKLVNEYKRRTAIGGNFR